MHDLLKNEDRRKGEDSFSYEITLLAKYSLFSDNHSCLGLSPASHV